MQKAHNNKELFSNYYLEERLPDRKAWQKPDGLTQAYQEISELYGEKKDILKSTKEAQTEEEWIKPILEILGFKYITQPSESIFDTTKVPDYAFFLNDEDKRKAYKAAEDNKEDLFNFALAVGDAKRWGRNLNELSPNKQIDEYLRITDSTWGILTNGRLWRIYHLDSSYRLDTYYEVDLVDLIEAGDAEKFKYFYLFFRPNSFVKDGFLTEVYERSEDFTTSVSEYLKENAFDALRELCQGFLSGNPELSEENLDDIYENSLVLLYRLIFLLYAESEEEENLLPMDNEAYRKTYSLQALKEKAMEKHNTGSLLSSSHQYWSRLRDLFSFIDKGQEQLGVYEYNGGLFDSDRHPFFKENSIGDKYIAEAIRKVSYSEAEGGFIDYQDLDVRELGAIYEGLLEHKPVIEEEQVKWEEDLSERKKTGSYYTPEYIVKYIVENTIDPLVEEKKEEIEEEINELKEKLKGSRGYDRETYQRNLEEKRKEVRKEILDLKVLDPAMGSGHFLVEATEKLANSIASLEEEFSPDNEEKPKVQETEKEDTVKELKRQIVERSIYGVDKNPLATELAKLSLWLHTVAKGEPLSFLDHHLRTGNSLTGIGVEKMKTMPSEREQMAGLFTSNLVQDLGNAIGHLNLIEEITSESRDDVQEKKTEWREVNDWIDDYKKAANVRLSTAFGNEINDDQYRTVLKAAANNNISTVQDKKFFKKAQKIAESKPFFHWELEFPDLFRDEQGKMKKNPGFDVVVGNPPWVSMKGKFGEKFSTNYINYLIKVFNSNSYIPNLYEHFVNKSLLLTKSGGFHSFIVPDRFGYNQQFDYLRKEICENYKIKGLIYKCAFPGVTADTLVYTFQKDKPQGTNEIPVKVSGHEYVHIKQKDYRKRKGSTFHYYLNPQVQSIISKIQRTANFKLGDKVESTSGFGGKSSKISEKKKHEGQVEIYKGEDITRYVVKDNHYFDFQDKFLTGRTRDKEKLGKKNKVLLRKTGDRLIAAFDDSARFPEQSLYFLYDASPSELKYILGLLNSKLITFFYKAELVTNLNSIPQLKNYHLNAIPVSWLNKYKPKIVEKVDLISRLKAKALKFNLRLQDHIGNYRNGKALKDLSIPVKGVSNTILNKTTNEKSKLKISDVEFSEEGKDLVLSVISRYKPDNKNGSQELDQWGYATSKPEPALRFSLDEKMKTLLKEFVPLAVEKAGGFANFRRNATKTISPIERLEELTLPKLADVGSGLEKYLKHKEKTEKLKKEIKETDNQLDAIVFALYSLNEGEVEMVLDSVETPEDEKSDILAKFREISTT